MINFLHFSDFHIQERRGILKDGIDPCLKLENVIEVAKDMHVKPAFSIITGDIAQDGLEKGYTLAKEYIQELEALGGPVFPTIGNVDRRKNFRNYMLKSSGKGPCFYSRIIGGLNIIILDSQTPGANQGSFGSVQLDWLEEELQRTQKPSIIAFHHPVFDVPFLSEMTPAIFDPNDARRFRDIVSKEDVLGVLCGHLHQCMVSMVGGVLYMMSGSAFSELFYNENQRKLHEASGFNFISYDGKGLTVRPVTFSEERKLIDAHAYD